LVTSNNWWAVNQKFIDRAISVKAKFHLQLPKAQWPGWFADEIDHILSSGQYELVSEGTEYWLKPLDN